MVGVVCMNVIFFMGMPFGLEEKYKKHIEIFNNCKIKYYLTNYINRWSCNEQEKLLLNKNYILNYDLDFVDCEIYNKKRLLNLYDKYFPKFYNLLLRIFNENEKDYESQHYFSQVQETINDYVYFIEIIENENLESYDKIIFMSLNMEFVEDEFDFISCHNDSILNFINDTNKFYTNRILRKSDFLFSIFKVGFL